jgi:hypothetical protein
MASRSSLDRNIAKSRVISTRSAKVSGNGAYTIYRLGPLKTHEQCHHGPGDSRILSAGCCISTKPRNATDTAILRREMHCKRNRSGSEFAVRLGTLFVPIGKINTVTTDDLQLRGFLHWTAFESGRSPANRPQGLEPFSPGTRRIYHQPARKATTHLHPRQANMGSEQTPIQSRTSFGVLGAPGCSQTPGRPQARRS